MGKEGVSALPGLVYFRRILLLASFLFFEESSRGGDPILQVCNPRHRNCKSGSVWCVDHQVTTGLNPTDAETFLDGQ